MGNVLGQYRFYHYCQSNFVYLFIFRLRRPTCEWHHPDQHTATRPILSNRADVGNRASTSIWRRTTSARRPNPTAWQLTGHPVMFFEVICGFKIPKFFKIIHAEKVFVHEWSHLRYGVFDEYGYQGDKKYPMFYKEPNVQAIQINLCTNNPPIFTTKFVCCIAQFKTVRDWIRISRWVISIFRDVVTQGPCKIDPATGVYDSNCAYEFQPEFLPDSSLMSVHSLDSVLIPAFDLIEYFESKCVVVVPV